MAQNNVLQFAPRRKEIDQQSVSVLAALAARLEHAPPDRPGGLEACVAHLAGGAEHLAQLPFGQRRLLTLRDSLFIAPGREPEMRRLWRETMATACNAAVLSRVLGLDESCVTAAALLHRISEVWLTAALADAEALTGARLRGAPLRELLNERGRHLLPRLVRTWALAPAVSQPLLAWRECGEDSPAVTPPGRAARAVYLSYLLAAEQLYAGYTTPGVVEAAAEELGIAVTAIAAVRAEFCHIDALLMRLV
jgi:hypothetical protein